MTGATSSVLVGYDQDCSTLTIAAVVDDEVTLWAVSSDLVARPAAALPDARLGDGALHAADLDGDGRLELLREGNDGAIVWRAGCS